MQDSRFGKIVAGCGAGGAATALLIQLFAPYWGLGGKLAAIALGGLMAYLAYDWRAFVFAVPTAYKAVVLDGPEGVRYVWEELRELYADPDQAPTQFLAATPFIGALCSFWFWGKIHFLWFFLLVPGLAIAFMVAGVVLFFVDYMLLLFTYDGLIEGNRELRKHWQLRLGILKYDDTPLVGSLGLVTWGQWGMLHWLALEYYLGYAVPRLVMWPLVRLWKLVAKVFRIIHCDLRMLCAVDGAIGGWLGYFVTHQVSRGAPLTPNGKLLVVLIGAAMAIVLGLLNYWYVSLPMLARQEQRR